MARSPPPGGPHTEATGEPLQKHWNDDGDGWGSEAGWDGPKTSPKPAASSPILQTQRRTTAVPKQRRPSPLFMALIVVAIAGGASAGWWWTLGDGHGNTKSITTTRSERELDSDIQKVTHAGKPGDQGDQRGYFASDVVDQQLAALGLKRKLGTGAGGPGLLRWSRFGLRGQRPQNPGVMRLAKGAGSERAQGEAGGEEGAGDAEEGLDQDGVGGGGVLVESRKAVFGADRHAHDARQPAHMRVGMGGALPGGAAAREREEGDAAHLALEQQSFFGMGDKEEQGAASAAVR